jgi:hypothetical protein
MSASVYSDGLSLKGPEIRLIRLDPPESRLRRAFSRRSSKNDPISCTLFKVSLDDKPHFDALSYTWGELTDTRSILLNGHEFKVTANLHNALRRLQRENEARVLWVDSVCVDQKNVKERNQQIQLMARIFSEAHTVRMWVGEKTSDSKLAIKGFEDWLFHAYYKDKGENPEAQKAVASYIKRTVKNDKMTAAISDFLSRPYWSRMWITQEILLAHPRARLHCGSDSMYWIQLANMIAMLHFYGHDSYDEPMDGFEASELMNAVGNLRHLSISGGDKPLAIAFTFTANLLATDPRDKIYGLLGIVDFKRYSDINIEPDYSKTTAEVYADFIRRALRSKTVEKEEKATFLLSAGLRHPTIEPSLNLPTWVPDFRGS